MSLTERPGLYIPLQKLDHCSVCLKSKGKLKVCGGCYEVIYCSQQCQKQDWKSHKQICDEPDKIDFETFWPFVAAVQQTLRLSPYKDGYRHPALQRQITNAPHHGADLKRFRWCNGPPAATCLSLGRRLSPSEAHSSRWAPTLSDEERQTLRQRLVNEGNLLPIVCATTLALIGEIYPAPSGSEDTTPRIKLMSRRSPISDIGIMKGSYTRARRMTYLDAQIPQLQPGQNPSEHCWIYLKSLDGNEQYLDCGIYTYNSLWHVDVSKYTNLKPGFGFPPDLGRWVPGIFTSHELQKGVPREVQNLTWKSQQRYSVLRDADLRHAIKDFVYGQDSMSRTIVCNWMDKIAGRNCDQQQQDTMLKLLRLASSIFRNVFQNQRYLDLPQHSEQVDMQHAERQYPEVPLDKLKEFDLYLRKQTRLQKRGKIAYKEWFERYKVGKKSLLAKYGIEESEHLAKDVGF